MKRGNGEPILKVDRWKSRPAGKKMSLTAKATDVEKERGV